MKNIKFLREPGFMRDLFFLFILNFNKDYCLATYINYNKAEEDTAYYNSVLSDFEDIPDDLILFFYLRKNKESFITHYYYIPFRHALTSSYNVEAVLAALANYDDVITKLLKFYFIDVDSAAIEEASKSVKKAGELIRGSNYSSDIKSALYSFVLDPVPVIQKLSYELLSKSFFLSQIYEKHFQKIADIQNSLNIDELSAQLKKYKACEINIDEADNLYISISYICKNYVELYLNETETILILGSDYKDFLGYKTTKNKVPDLDAFGTAISEINRIQILDLILRKEEITIRDIEQSLGFTGTNAYYHLTLMMKAGLIKSRNQGRTVLYSINKQAFTAVITMLSKYSDIKQGD